MRTLRPFARANDVSPRDEGDGSGVRVVRIAPIRRRKWESVVTREEIARLLAERRLGDLLARLRAARAIYPHDLELLRSVRVLAQHLGE